MALSLLEQAKKEFAKKNYAEVISLLQPHVLEYKDSFDYYLYLGLAFMHTGEIALALDYFSGARKIKITDPTLLSAQGTLFLRKGNTSRAVDYYLQALTNDPNCRTAKKGLEFLRHHNSPEEIGDFIQTGKIKTLYPDPSYAYKKKKFAAVGFFSCVVLISLALLVPLAIKKLNTPQPMRKDLSALTLLDSDKKDAVQISGNFSTVMTKDEVIKTYEKAQKYFQDYRDNMAQYEVNRLLASNASTNIKQKAQLLSEYFEVPGFDTIKDLFEYASVKDNPAAYAGCHVIWRGMASNMEVLTYNMAFDLLVGYDTKTKLEGVVPVICPFITQIDTETPIEVLAQIAIKQGGLYLTAVSIYQSGKPLKIR